MNFEAAKQYIINRLIHELPSKLYYHGLHHTFDVYEAAKELAAAEQITGEELVLLKTAALFHDIGFIEQYSHNEPVAIKIVKQELPQFGYNEEQINIISAIIMATSRSEQPTTILEKIICDADLDYLGGDNFNRLSAALKKELAEYGFVYNDYEWDELQIKFLKSHQYYTKSAIEKNDLGKQKHIDRIKERHTK